MHLKWNLSGFTFISTGGLITQSLSYGSVDESLDRELDLPLGFFQLEVHLFLPVFRVLTLVIFTLFLYQLMEAILVEIEQNLFHHVPRWNGGDNAEIPVDFAAMESLHHLLTIHVVSQFSVCFVVVLLFNVQSVLTLEVARVHSIALRLIEHSISECSLVLNIVFRSRLSSSNELIKDLFCLCNGHWFCLHPFRCHNVLDCRPLVSIGEQQRREEPFELVFRFTHFQLFFWSVHIQFLGPSLVVGPELFKSGSQEMLVVHIFGTCIEVWLLLVVEFEEHETQCLNVFLTGQGTLCIEVHLIREMGQ